MKIPKGSIYLILTALAGLLLSACSLLINKNERAEQAILAFFDHLAKAEYAEAAILYGGKYAELISRNPQADPEDAAALLKLGCQDGSLHCRPIRIATFNEKTDSGEYIFTVQFSNPDGSLFVQEACCGDTPTIPPKFEFEYRVVECEDGKFRLLDLPLADSLITSDEPIVGPDGAVDIITLPDGTSLRFPIQPTGDGSVMEALVEGPLTLVDGCLRIGLAGGDDPGFLVLWPAGSSARVAEIGTLEVWDRDEQIIGRAGETIRLGGGAMEDTATLEFWDAQIPGMPIEGCPGPYWIAGQTYPLSAFDYEQPPADVAHLGMPWSDFSLRFDPQVWEITSFQEDMPELQALTHQSLAGGCRIIPNVPVGLGDDWTSLDGQVALGQLTLNTKRFFQDGELRFVVYYGFLGSPMEGAVEVHFEFDGDDCLAAAEALFAETDVIIP